MKVWLNERFVKLCRTRPEGTDYHYVATRKEVSLLYHAFEADPTQKTLLLYADDYARLKSHFFDQFNIVVAAGGFVKNEYGEILFIFRRGRWDLPKGKLNSKKDAVEKKQDAAVREVMEETGLQQVELVGKMARTCHIFFEKRQRWLKKTFWYEMRAPKDQPVKPQTEEDITEVRWIRPEDLPHTLEGAYPSLRKLFA